MSLARNKNIKVKSVISPHKSLKEQIKRDFKMNKFLIFMAIPVLAYYIIFHYIPMYGVIIAFKDYSPARGILGSAWVGFDHFKNFFGSYYAWRVIRNTLVINFYHLIFVFPSSIILALLLNEIRAKIFKKTVQTITYLPHFISLVVICGMITDFTSLNGVINDIIVALGGERVNFLMDAKYFRSIYILSDIWQTIGWSSIIYMAALAGIDQELYEASACDGAGRFRQMWSITLPGIMPTIIIMFLLAVGRIMSIGFEKIILLYNSNTYETADVISSFVYRRGIIDSDYSFSSAVGLFNSIVNIIFLTLANHISAKVTETSLW